MTHAVVISLTAVVLLLAADKSGELRKNQYVWVPPSKPAPVVADADTDKGKPPPHQDKVEDLPEGKGRETTFYTCAACHGVALIKAQGMSRELWDAEHRLHDRAPPHAGAQARGARRDPRLSRRAVPATPPRARRTWRGQSVPEVI